MSLISRLPLLLFSALVLAALPARAENPAPLIELKDGDRAVLLGDGLIEREQKSAYIETLLTAAWPGRNITFRNLGYTGDTPRGESRVGFGSDDNTHGWRPPAQRDPNFGFTTMLRQIEAARPTVILVGYGSAAAFDDAQVAGFANDFDRLLTELAKTKARLVLLTPTPHEKITPAQLDPSPRNRRLLQVSDAIRAAAKSHNLPMVDCFAALSVPAGQHNETPLTENGIHLSDAGYRKLAAVVAKQLGIPIDPWQVEVSAGDKKLTAASKQLRNAKSDKTEFGLWLEAESPRLPTLADAPSGQLRAAGLKRGKYAVTVDGRRIAMVPAEELARGYEIKAGPEFEQYETLRTAIIEKNRLYFQHFRPQNEAYIFLFRRHERGDHASEIAQLVRRVEEKDQEIARLNTPVSHRYELIREKDYPEHWVPTNVAPPDTAAELKALTVADGFEVNLFAADPLVVKPINFNFDERGRMVVATSTIYPHLSPGDKPDDKILVLEDLDHDGRADRSTVFADHLLIPHSVIPGDGGVYVTQSTELLFLKDTDGDGKADVRRTLLSGFGNADVHHMIHTLRWGVGGNLYFNQSIYINSSVETPWGVRRLNGSGIWSFDPKSLKLDVVCRGMVNPWGHAIDRWGQQFATDGAAGGGIHHVFPGAAYMTASNAMRQLTPLNPGHVKACGLEVLSGRHIPPDWQDTLVTTDFLANRVVRYKLAENGSGYVSQQMPQVLKSSHRSFRPVDIKMGPDGAIYIADWYNAVIDHGEVDFHHPLRDHRHGRIWRLTAKGRPLVTPPALADASVENLLDTLKLPEACSRDQARRLLRERGRIAVVPALKAWLAALDAAGSDADPLRLEALWVTQGLCATDAGLLQTLLAAKDYRVRAAAVRVLNQSQDQASVSGNSLQWLSTAIEDEHPQVRLEAVTAARKIGTLPAANLALRVLDKPLDANLDYAAWLTARELQDVWLPALQTGKPVFGGNSHRLFYALAAIGNKDAMQPLTDLLSAGKLAPAERLAALSTIAEQGRPEQVQLVVSEIIKSAANDEASLRLLQAALRGTDRKQAAPANGSELLPLLESKNLAIAGSVARLAGQWRLKSAQSKLASLAGMAETNPVLMREAAQALALLGDRDSVSRLVELSGAGSSENVRRAAVAALASVNPAAAAPRAVELLAAMKKSDDPAPLMEPFLSRREGPGHLAKALSGHTLPAQVADACIRMAEASGRPLEPLVAALQKARSSGASDSDLVGDRPTDALRAALLAEFEKSGNASRGETIFRRADMACQRCHAIGGAGGHVGPDLAGLGGSAQPGYLLESLLEPSAKIKDGFQAVSVLKDDGTMVGGIAAPKVGGMLPLRDAQNVLQLIPLSRIEEMSTSTVSLMPQGLVRSLRRQEMLDLLKFLSVLGREPQFTMSTRPLVRHWEVLTPGGPLPPALRGKLDVAALEKNGAVWTPCFSTVEGMLPVAELPMLDTSPRMSVVRFHIETAAAGMAWIHSPKNAGVQLLQDGQLGPLGFSSSLSLASGRQTLFLVIDRSAQRDPIELEVGDNSLTPTYARPVP